MEKRGLAVVVLMIGACCAYACDREDRPKPVVQPAPPPPPAAVPHAMKPSPLQEDPGAENGAEVTRAVAVLQPAKGSKVQGTITFTARKESDVLAISANVSGLPAGKHAFHVHQFGDCTSEDGKSAGTHFNFAGSSEKPGDQIARITGNLGDLEAGKDGKASSSTTVARATLQGQYSILGRSVIIHEKENDPKSPPMGAAGGRLACGVIGVADSDTVATAATTNTQGRGG